jgi:hypothetical protein
MKIEFNLEAELASIKSNFDLKSEVEGSYIAPKILVSFDSILDNFNQAYLNKIIEYSVENNTEKKNEIKDDDSITKEKIAELYKTFKLKSNQLVNLVKEKLKYLQNKKLKRDDIEQREIEIRRVVNIMIAKIDSQLESNSKLLELNISNSDIFTQRERILQELRKDLKEILEKRSNNVIDDLTLNQKFEFQQLDIDDQVETLIEKSTKNAEEYIKRLEDQIEYMLRENEDRLKNMEENDKTFQSRRNITTEIDSLLERLKKLNKEKENKEKEYNDLRENFNSKFREFKMKEEEYNTENSSYFCKQIIQIVFLVVILAMIIGYMLFYTDDLTELMKYIKN